MPHATTYGSNASIGPFVGVYIVMVGIDAIEIASDAILIASQQSTDHILAGQTAT